MKRLILPLAICASIICARGQSLVDEQADSLMASHRIISLGDGKVTATAPDNPAVRERIYSFYYDQFRHAQDPEAPYFMFLSKDDKLLMGIGGTIRMRAWYDWGGSVPSSGFSPIQIPMTPDPAARKHLGTTPAGTCLFFRLAGQSSLLGYYSAYIEANFNGWSGSDFHLKKAYVTVRDFTVGYAASTFSDPAAVPMYVDANGPSNKFSRTAVLVRYMPQIARHWYVGASVEAPETAVAADQVKTEKCTAYIPDFAALVQYEWARGQHLRLAGIVRSLPYRDLVAEKNHNLAGWGMQLSTVSHPCAPLTVYGTFNYGCGYAGLGGDLLVGSYDLISNPDQAGRLYAPRSLGWCLGVQYNIRRDLFVTLAGSQTRFLPQKQIDPSEYKYGLLGTFNIFWNPTPRLQFGAEIDLAKRQNFSREHRYARRFGLMGQITF